MNFQEPGARLLGGETQPRPEQTDGSATTRRRVVMLVANPCVNDSRVIRAAESVAEEGHDVIVLATKAKGVPDREQRNGVVYQRCGLPAVAQSKSNTRPRAVPLGARFDATVNGLKQRVAPTPLGTVLKKLRSLWKRNRVMLSAAAIVTAAALLAFFALRALENSGHNIVALLLTFGLGLAAGAALMALVAWRLSLRGTAGKKSSGLGRLARIRPMTTLNTKLRQSVSTKGIKSVAKNVTRMSAQAAKSHLRVAYTALRSEAFFKHPLEKLKPDIIHAHDFATLPVASRVARRSGAICIYDSHELEMHRNIKRSRFDRWLCGELERRYIKRVDGVITVCDSIADHLADYYRICRPTVVMNAPSFAVINGDERDVRSDLGLSPETPLAIYVGSITIGRGIETIVHALRSLPDFHLVLLGPANKGILEGALEAAKNDGTASRLHVLPPVLPSSVVPYVRTADVSLVLIQNVCLSYYYCLPNKLVESTIAGLPVVASDFPELRKFVQTTGTGVVTNERDSDAIARAIREAYERRHDLRPDEARRKIIDRHYGWETQRRKLVGLYDRLLEVQKPALRAVETP